jgi:hypothetical protein
MMAVVRKVETDQQKTPQLGSRGVSFTTMFFARTLRAHPADLPQGKNEKVQR